MTRASAGLVLALGLVAGAVSWGEAPLGDGKADCTAAIQALLDAAAAGPGVAELPAGRFRITGTLDVPSGVTLAGPMPRWENSHATLIVEENGFSAVRLNNHSNVKGLAFSYPNNQKGDEPDVYPPAILLVGINPSVESVVFDSAWIGIATPPEGANTGQSLFRDITGFTHRIGIRLDGTKDIVRIEDVHWFVPAYGGSFYRRERVGFSIGSTDGILMARCFMIGGRTFFHQETTNGTGGNVHSLGHHITQCWVEAVTYGFLIEGTCGLVLSDTQIYVSDPAGAGIVMRMPHLYYHSVIGNTQVRCDGSQALGIEYAPTGDHPRNHLMLHHCQVFEASVSVRLGEKARRVWVTENHLGARDAGIVIENGATDLVVKDNMVQAPKAVDDHSAPDAVKEIEGNRIL
ncbi:MAG TPA: glycosyl hydrolase family 28-related protein [Candidatus Hydrogenedentes bacterium]|nr:glycosyl hydrolase family 28-related protein [Candidatus Hydrogenedentota bacterium]HPG67969.1 glycosyl hydrolase family 28-related protein [Candidatus Hydrogenedentota bacterium]